MALGRPLVEGYWVDHDVARRFGGRRVDLGRIPSTTPVDVVKIAPFPLRSANGVTVGPETDRGRKWAQEIADLRAAGVRVLASLGGEDYLGWKDIADPQAFAANVKGLVDELGLDGVDVDNEDDGIPDESFEAVVTAIRAELGDDALLTSVTYQPWRDLGWLKRVGHAFDWVSTMSYWDDARGHIALWRQYAEVLGGANVLIGVACPGCADDGKHTDLETVREVAEWVTRQGPGAAGGMMLWCLSAGPVTERYYDAIGRNLTTWRPP